MIRFLRSKPSSEQYQHEKEALITNFRNDGAQEGVVRLFEAIVETIATATQEIQRDRETFYKTDLYLVGGSLYSRFLAFGFPQKGVPHFRVWQYSRKNSIYS